MTTIAPANCIEKKAHCEEFELFSIGYEQRTIEEYVSLLTNHSVTLVIDVRRNPISRKKGFSKTALSNHLKEANIGYIHLRSLGIDSSLRKQLETKEDYEELFEYYRETSLPQNHDDLEEIRDLLNTHERIALTCFEKDHRFCHRNQIINYSKEKGIIDAPVYHI